MAEKSFGIKELNLIGASGTPSIDSPNNLNLNAVNVAISTNVSIGGTLTVTGNVSIGGTLTYEDVTNIDSVGLITARNGLNVTAGVSTFADEIHGNNQRLGSLSSSGRFNGLFLNDGYSYYGNNKLFVSSSTGFGLEAYADMDSYLKANSGGGTSGNCYMRTGSSSGGYVFVNGDNGVEIHHAGTSNKKFETTSSGATVTGILTATTFSGSGASLTNLPATDPTNSDIQVVYTVTANGSSSYRFAGNGVVSTADNPNLYLIRGQKYRFINNSGGSHPFQIRESSGGTAYNTGVTNNGAASGNIDFAPTFDSPAQIVYQCTSHGGMVGNIYLRDAAGQNRNVGLTTFVAGIDVDGGPINIINGGGAYNTHLNYNDSGQNYITMANGSNTVFRGSSNSVTSLIVHGSGQLDIYDRIRHLGDTDTFMEFSTDTVRFDTAGSERLRITSDGKIGINSTSPQTKLDVIAGYTNRTWTPGSSVVSMFERSGHCRIALVANATSYSQIDFGDTNDDNAGYIKYDHNDNSMSFRTNTAERLRIHSDGQIGIGTDSPDSDAYIHIVGPDNRKIILEDNDNNGANLRKNYIGIQGSDNLVLAADEADLGTSSSIRFRIDNTEKVRITSAGRVGIGTDSLTKLLDIATSTSADGIRVRSTGNTYNEIEFDANRISASNHIGRIVSKWNGTLVSYISLDTGTDTTNKDDGQIRFFTSASGGSNVERLRIASNGNVGINENNPSTILHVENDNANSTYYLNSDAAILVQNKNSNATAKTVLKLEGPVGGGDCALVYGSSSTNLIVSDRQHERLRINSSGTITTPYQFHIEVRRSGNQTGYDARSSAGGTPVVFNDVVTTRGTTNSALNTSTGKITVPVDGVYFLEASVYTSSGNALSQGWFTEGSSRMTYSDITEDENTDQVQAHGMHYLSANTQVGFHAYGATASNITIEANIYHTWFRVTLIG